MSEGEKEEAIYEGGRIVFGGMDATEAIRLARESDANRIARHVARRQPWEDDNKPIVLGQGERRWYFEIPLKGEMSIPAVDALEALEHERVRAERAESALSHARAEAAIARNRPATESTGDSADLNGG